MVGRTPLGRGPGAIKRHLTRDLLPYNKTSKNGWPYQSEWHCYLPDRNADLPDTVEEEQVFYKQALDYANQFPKTYGEEFRGQAMPESPSQNMVVGPNSETPPPLVLQNMKTALVLWKMGDGPMCLNGPNPGAPSEEQYKFVNDRDHQEYGSKLKWDQAYLDNVVAADWKKIFYAAFLGGITLVGKNQDKPDVYQGSQFTFDGTEPCSSKNWYVGAACGAGGTNLILMNQLCNTAGSRNKMYTTINNDPNFDEYNLIVHIVNGCWTTGGASFQGSDGRKHLYIFLSPNRDFPGSPYYGMYDDREWNFPQGSTDYPTAPWNGCGGPINFDVWDTAVTKFGDFKDVHENRSYINMALHEFAHNLTTQGWYGGFSHLMNHNVVSNGGCTFSDWECWATHPDCSSSYSSQNPPCNFLVDGPDGGNCQTPSIGYTNLDIFDVMGTVGAYNVSQSAPKMEKMGYTAFGGGTVQPNVPYQNWRGIIPDSMVYDLTSENQNAPGWSWEGWLDAADYLFKFPDDPVQGKQVMIKTVLESNKPKPASWTTLNPVPRRFLNIVYYSRGHIDMYGIRRRAHNCMTKSGPFDMIESPDPRATEAGVLMVYWGPYQSVQGLWSFGAFERIVDVSVDPNNEKFQIGPFSSGGSTFPGWKVYVIADETGVSRTHRRKIKLKITKA